MFMRPAAYNRGHAPAGQNTLISAGIWASDLSVVSLACTSSLEGRIDEQDEPINPWFLAEFCCWTMAVLAPILTWVNRPAVSTDQVVVRTTVFVLALGGVIGLRATNIFRKRRNKAK